MDLADYGSVGDRQGSAGIRSRGAANSNLCLVGCVDYAVLQVDGCKRRSPNGPGYRVSDLERAAGGLDNQPRTARACRGGSNRESRARDQRAVNQRKSMELVVLIPRGLERNCYGA